MSLYSCVDLLAKLQKIFEETTHYPNERDLINTLHEKLLTRANNDNYEELDKEIALIDAYKKQNNESDYFKEIYDDLRMIVEKKAGKKLLTIQQEIRTKLEETLAKIQKQEEGIKELSKQLELQIEQLAKQQKDSEEMLATVQQNEKLKELSKKIKLQIEKVEQEQKDIEKMLARAQQDKTQVEDAIKNFPQQEQGLLHLLKKYQIATIYQGQDYRLGNSGGECLGYTYAMVDPQLSPYQNKVSELHLTRKIRDYQINQHAKKPTINKSRLTRRHFCPNIQQQAEEIYELANDYRDKDIYVSLSRRGAAHATYISVRNDGSIRYMDPNYSAYLFNNKEDFFRFYNEIYTNKNGDTLKQYKFYQLATLVYDPTGSLPEENSFQGKIRTFLTGPKYKSTQDSLLEFIIFETTGILLSCSALIILLMILPFEIGTLGIFCLSLATEIISFILSLVIINYLKESGYRGLFALPHFIQESWYDYTTSKQPSSFINEEKPAESANLVMNKSLIDLAQQGQKPIQQEEMNSISSCYTTLFHTGSVQNSSHNSSALLEGALVPSPG